MEYLEQNIQKYYANEITLEELKEVLHFLIDDVTIPDAKYTKSKMKEITEGDYHNTPEENPEC